MNQTLPLRDIHLPETIGWWPPALGWWLLLIIVPLLVYALWRLYKRLTRKTVVKSALQQLQTIQQSGADDLEKLRQLSALLRRVAISTAPRARVASLTGADWLAYLDNAMPDKPFTQGIGRYLAEAHYRSRAPEGLDIQALCKLCEQWIKTQR